MADYFLVHDATAFESEVRPALAAVWRRRSFEPCHALCAQLIPAARSYAGRYHTGPEEFVLERVATGLSFDRTIWRTLVGEVLLFAALDIPEFPSNADTLGCLLAPEHYASGRTDREHLAPIQQVFRGSRDLTFGSAVYRPEYAGYNNPSDVARLAGYLGGIDPASWTTAALHGLREVTDEEDRADELQFAREWFPVVRDLYVGARDRGHVLVLESIY
jgi:hypothetical protein